MTTDALTFKIVTRTTVAALGCYLLSYIFAVAIGLIAYSQGVHYDFLRSGGYDTAAVEQWHAFKYMVTITGTCIGIISCQTAHLIQHLRQSPPAA